MHQLTSKIMDKDFATKEPTESPARIRGIAAKARLIAQITQDFYSKSMLMALARIYERHADEVQQEISKTAMYC